jgi:hypothetical protein
VPTGTECGDEGDGSSMSKLNDGTVKLISPSFSSRVSEVETAMMGGPEKLAAGPGKGVVGGLVTGLLSPEGESITSGKDIVGVGSGLDLSGPFGS